MFCGKCGNQLNDSAKFCNKCGNPVKKAENTEPVVNDIKLEVMPGYTPPMEVMPNVSQYAPQKSKPLEKTDDFKKSLGAIIVIVAVLLYTIVLIGNIATALNPDNSTLSDFYSELNVEEAEEIEDLIDTLSPIVPAAAVVGMIPTILIAIGLWINTAQAYTKGKLYTTGFTFIKVASIIRIACTSLAVLVAIAGLFVIPFAEDMLYELTESLDSEVFEVIGDHFALAIMAISSVALTQILPIIYDVVILLTIGRMKKSNENSSNKYTALVILNYIFVAINALKLLFNIVWENIIAVNIIDIIDDFDLLTRKEINSIEEILKGVFGLNIWAIAASVMTVAALVLFNVYLSNLAKGKQQPRLVA